MLARGVLARGVLAWGVLARDRTTGARLVACGAGVARRLVLELRFTARSRTAGVGSGRLIDGRDGR